MTGTDRWAQTKADVLRRCAERTEAAKLRANKPALDSPRAIAELHRLWRMRALTMVGVAERWSAFLGVTLSVHQVRAFAKARRAEFPDRRALNYGVVSYSPPRSRFRQRMFVDEALQDQQFDVLDAREL